MMEPGCRHFARLRRTQAVDLPCPQRMAVFPELIIDEVDGNSCTTVHGPRQNTLTAASTEKIALKFRLCDHLPYLFMLAGEKPGRSAPRRARQHAQVLLQREEG